METARRSIHYLIIWCVQLYNLFRIGKELAPKRVGTVSNEIYSVTLEQASFVNIQLCKILIKPINDIL